MKTKTLQMTSGLLMVIFWLATITLHAQIAFKGHHNDHEGGVGWDADGTGIEPAGDGHNSQYYYTASPDYNNIDPDPSAAMAHILEINDGFPEFAAALEQSDIDLSWIKIRLTLCSLGGDEEGVDWLVIGNSEYNNYYGASLRIFLQNEVMVSMAVPYFNFAHIDGSGIWSVETPFLMPKDASLLSSEEAKTLAAAFLNDVEGQSIQLSCTATYSGFNIDSDGRIGAWYNLSNGLLVKGTPEIPFKGLNADHEGLAGWNADGTGPEPEGDGHLTYLYYGASLDYGGIDDNAEACFGHFLEGASGFKNLLLQLEYRGYTIEDFKLKMGLISLANDEEGIDWGNNWSNYYNQFYTFLLDGEPILEMLSDTCKLIFNGNYHSSNSTFSPVKNISQTASEDAQKVAEAFLLDLNNHQLVLNSSQIIATSNHFTGNGRDGYFYNIYQAKLQGKCGMVNCIGEGNLMGILRASNSPYLINGNVEVPVGQTLTIEPGTKIAFRGPYRIYVKGSVKAIGKSEEPITFTHSNPLLLWDGFDYDSTATPNDTSFFKHCVFEYGYGFGSGAYNSGGIFALAYFDKLVVENSTFRYNRVNKAGTYAPSGGAVALWHASPMFVNCIFHDNQAKYGGAMMVFNYSEPVISNCLFYDNVAEQDGGALEIWSSSNATIINNTFADNFAKNGGAIDIYANSNPIIINTLMWGNRADVEGNQVNLGSLCFPGFYYSNVQGGPDDFGGSTFGGEYVECIDEGPMFLEADEFPIFYPGDGPCYNAGTPDDSPWFMEEFIAELDLFGYERIREGRIDIGAYESLIATVPETNSNNSKELNIYPNPFHHSTNIEFTLEKASWVQIDLYNLIGEKVDIITQSNLPAGKHTLTWQKESLAKGVYFVRLQTGNDSSTYKILKN